MRESTVTLVYWGFMNPHSLRVGPARFWEKSWRISFAQSRKWQKDHLRYPMTNNGINYQPSLIGRKDWKTIESYVGDLIKHLIPRSLTVRPWKVTSNRKGSSSNRNFSGAMLNFGEVWQIPLFCFQTATKPLLYSMISWFPKNLMARE